MSNNLAAVHPETVPGSGDVAPRATDAGTDGGSHTTASLERAEKEDEGVGPPLSTESRKPSSLIPVPNVPFLSRQKVWGKRMRVRMVMLKTRRVPAMPNLQLRFVK